jgi:nucleotide-binding universal stress UspA family protein
MKVFVAIDGSENSKKIVEFVSRLCHAERDEVTIATFFATPHVFDPALETVDGMLFLPNSTAISQENELRGEWIEYGQKIVDAVEKQLLDAGFGEDRIMKEVKETGDLRHGILHEAEVAGAEMIVVGSRGLGMIKRAVLGSVSSHVVHNSPVPVLVVH